MVCWWVSTISILDKMGRFLRGQVALVIDGKKYIDFCYVASNDLPAPIHTNPKFCIIIKETHFSLRYIAPLSKRPFSSFHTSIPVQKHKHMCPCTHTDMPDTLTLPLHLWEHHSIMTSITDNGPGQV